MNTQTHERQNYYIYSMERLKGGGIERLSWEKVYSLLDDLSEKLPAILIPLNISSKFSRARVLSTDNKFPTIRTLSYPSKEACISFGRCNNPNSPMYYAGVGSELIFSEIGAKIGDIVGILHTSPFKDIFCIRIGALNLWRRTNGNCLMADSLKAEIKDIYNDPENIIAFLFDAFISDYFSRPADPITYKLTSAYTSVILNAQSDIGGLIYDSVSHTAGSCIAFKPSVFDSQLRPTEVQIVRITNYLGYGVYDFEQLEYSNEFEDEKIRWA